MASEKKRELVHRVNDALYLSCGCVVRMDTKTVREVYVYFGAQGGMEMERKAIEDHVCSESKETTFPPRQENPQ